VLKILAIEDTVTVTGPIEPTRHITVLSGMPLMVIPRIIFGQKMSVALRRIMLFFDSLR